MNDLHTNQGRAEARRPKVRVKPKPVGVFRQPITAPSLRPALKRATKNVIHAQQQVPDVKVANRNITRLVQREKPQYRRETNVAIKKALVVTHHPKARRPTLHILPGTTILNGRKTFGNYPFAAYVDHNGARRINVTLDTVDASFHAPWKGRVYARETPVHELAHTLQRPSLSAAQSEGGAEAFKAAVDEARFLPDVTAPSYLQWELAAEKRGRRWVLRDQFQRRLR